MSRRCAREGVAWPRVVEDSASAASPVSRHDILHERVESYALEPQNRAEILRDSYWLLILWLQSDVASRRHGVCSGTPWALERKKPVSECPRWALRGRCRRQEVARSDCWKRVER